MTPLDQALKNLHEDPESLENRHHFYSLFLQSTFFVPIFDQESGGMAKADGKEADPEKDLPLIMEADGSNFMMLFDEEERVTAWAEEEVQCLTMPGYVAVAMATEGLHLAMNVGSDHSKQFVPEEINWLKQVVEKSAETGAE